MWYVDRKQQCTSYNWMINPKCPFIHVTAFSSVLKSILNMEDIYRSQNIYENFTICPAVAEPAGTRG